ncbi:MAG: tRNA (adenosine(37)-N6)-threonylcarbamoyltransferase complex dimerization subunit type 1 TsaB [Caldilinea sp.]
MLLALDTASTTASVAVYDPDRAALLGEITWEGRRRQTQNLIPQVRQLLETVGVSVDQLGALAVTTGPGSFAGVRIAISAAKGIGLGLATVPAAVGVPTLAVTAAPWLGVAAGYSPAPEVCAILAAGRGRYYWAFFSAGERLLRPGPEAHQTGSAAELADALARAGRKVWLVGEVDSSLAAAVQRSPECCVAGSVASLRRAGVLAELASDLLSAGISDSLAALQPLYLREP